VLLRAEEPDLAVAAAERLEPLEEPLAVVQDGGRRVERERAIGLDSRVVPALLLFEVHDEHVVGEELTEPQLAVLGLGLPRRRLGDPDRLRHLFPLTPFCPATQANT